MLLIGFFRVEESIKKNIIYEKKKTTSYVNCYWKNAVILSII